MFKKKWDLDQFSTLKGTFWVALFVELKLYLYCLLRATNLPFPQYLYF